MIKLHLGCGKRYFGKDWVHIDGGDFDYLEGHDITKLNYENDTVDCIYNSHVLMYFDREEGKKVLQEWYRVLKPNGILRLATPNFEVMNKLYIEGKISLDNMLGPLYGKMKMGEETIYAKTTYDFKSLKKLLKEIGFKNVREYDWRETEHNFCDDHSQAYIPHMDKENGVLISLNVDCVK